METWQIFLTIVGLVISAITAFGVFYGPRLVAKRQEKSGKLRAHFEDVKKEAQNLIPKFAENYGKIMIIVEPWHRGLEGFTATLQNITESVLSQPPDSFTAHFPKETREYADCKKRVLDHNQSYEQFCLKIKNALKSQGVPVVDIKSTITIIPCVYDIIYNALFNLWKELAENRPPCPDLKQIDKKTQGDHILLYAKGWGASAIACVANDSDESKYERLLGEVAENNEFREEGYTLLGSADNLVEEARAIDNRLSNKMDAVSKYWPGTIAYTFKKEIKRCTKCKEIFS